MLLYVWSLQPIFPFENYFDKVDVADCLSTICYGYYWCSWRSMLHPLPPYTLRAVQRLIVSFKFTSDLGKSFCTRQDMVLWLFNEIYFDPLELLISMWRARLPVWDPCPLLFRDSQLCDRNEKIPAATNSNSLWQNVCKWMLIFMYVNYECQGN